MMVNTLIATVLLDPPTALLFGCLVALVSSRLIARNPDGEIPRTGAFGAAWGAFYALSVGWFFFRYPDWMFAYLRDARDVPLLPAYVVFVLICAAFGAAGALGTAALIRRGMRGAAWAVTFGALLTIGATFYLQLAQYLVVGTFADFWAGRAAPIQSVGPMQVALNVSGAVATAGAAAALVTRFLQSRRGEPRGAPHGSGAA